jgi:hypothetical protein
MKIPITGGCLCGAVRYECTEPPIVMFNCHCRTCQMVTGGPYTPVVLLKSKAFKLTQGSLKHHFTEKVTGGGHKRGFCGECGSRVTGAESDRRLPWIAVTASSLDDPSGFQPQYDIFTSHAQPWDLLNPAIPKHEEYPPK